MILRIAVMAFCGLFLLLLVSGSIGSAASQEQKFTLANNAWMAGCWQPNDEPDSIEQWMKPVDNMRMGMSRTVVNGKVVAYEFMQIRQKPDGGIYFIVKLPGKPEEIVKAVKNTPTETIFEDVNHPFPQRIIYRQQSDGSLFARLD